MALQYAIIDEEELEHEREVERMKYTIFAANPRLYKAMFDKREIEMVEPDEWITPKSADEFEEFLNTVKEFEQGGFKDAAEIAKE